jgi:hypothetical protein
MPRPLASAPIPDLYRGMNKTEEARAIDLEAMKRAGLIVEWWYERWTFKLADDLRFTPDYVIQENSGELRIEEIKGFWRDDARAKIKMFAALFPFRVTALKRNKNGGWDVENF